MIRVWTSTTSPPNNESQITTNSLLTGTRAPGDGTRTDMTWTFLGNFNYPVNGAMSVDGWAFIGWCDPRNGSGAASPSVASGQ